MLCYASKYIYFCVIFAMKPADSLVHRIECSFFVLQLNVIIVIHFRDNQEIYYGMFAILFMFYLLRLEKSIVL